MKKIELPPRGLETLFGVHDQNIKYLESLLDVRIDARGQDVSIDGDPGDVETAQRILEDFSDLFKEGKGVVTQGRLGTDGVFVASEVLAKHDENYMPPEVADALKQAGVWRQDGADGDVRSGRAVPESAALRQ